jgi:D-3-phosphoglycerate dehydrogenase / 2-oxoglutarate reductase
METRMKGVYPDASDGLADIFRRVVLPHDPVITLHEHKLISAAELPEILAGHDFMLNDHTFLPTETMARCERLRHVIFLGTGARSYMDVEALEGMGVTVHTIKGYGDRAVAEHAFALMGAAARDIAAMDRAIRAGGWVRSEGMELGGKTLGLLGFGGIAGHMARLASGAGMRVLAWNRRPRTAAGVTFVDLPELLAESHVLSLHLLLTDETRHILDAAALAAMRPGAILVNTARGGLVDEGALVAALQSGHLRHAALDVFDTEPLPAGHPFAALPNVTLAAHSGFNTPEAAETLIRRGLDIAKGLSEG